MKAQHGLKDCVTCPIRGQAVVCDLTDDEAAEFHAIKHVFRYEPRQTVFYEGHACLGLYVLCVSRVKLTRSSVTGRRQIVGLLDAGEVIEKHAFMEQGLHTVTCETLEPSQACMIEREPYLAILRQNSGLALRLLGLLSNEVGRQMDQFDRLAFMTARQRLAGLLVEMVDRFGGRKNGEHPVGIALTREEVAELAGVAVETAIRLLSAFRREELVRVEGRQITLLRPERLARIARR